MYTSFGYRGAQTQSVLAASEIYLAGIAGGAVVPPNSAIQRVFDLTNYGTDLVCVELIRFDATLAGSVNVTASSYFLPPPNAGVPYLLTLDVPKDMVVVAKGKTVNCSVRVVERECLA